MQAPLPTWIEDTPEMRAKLDAHLRAEQVRAVEIAKRHFDAGQPHYPSGFSIFRRNPGHWDVHASSVPGAVSAWLEANPGSSTSARDGERERAFRIRGEPGNVHVFDERWNPHRLHPRETRTFQTVADAVAWIAGELMTEPVKTV